MTKKKAFLDRFLPVAVKVGEEFNLNPSVILAQAALEGNFGTSFSAKWRKNHFGITASGKPNKYWSGEKSQSSVSGLWFRIYKTDFDGFADFARLITSKYQACAKKSYKTDEYARCIAQSPYISEQNGDDRSAYQQTVAKYAKEFQPIVDKYVRDATRRKKLLILTITLSLLVIVGYFTYQTLKNKKQ